MRASSQCIGIGIASILAAASVSALTVVSSEHQLVSSEHQLVSSSVQLL